MNFINHLPIGDLNSIVLGKKTVFIASKDFEFKKLPILKNSLVYYDGEEEICINICKLHLIEEIVPSISSILKDQQKH